MAIAPGDKRAITERVTQYLLDYERYGFLNRVTQETQGPTKTVARLRSVMQGPVTLTIEVEPSEPYRITSLRLEPSADESPPPAPTPQAPVITPSANSDVAMPDTPAGRAARRWTATGSTAATRWARVGRPRPPAGRRLANTSQVTPLSSSGCSAGHVKPSFGSEFSCRGGGTGRRSGLRSHCPKGRAGSSPVPGTTMLIERRIRGRNA